MNKTAGIVIVDDDILVTKALGILLKIEGFKSVQLFNNPIDAVEYIKGNKPSVVISDFMMPQMNGIDFLLEVKKYYEDTSLILLTGYADKENAIRAINEVGLYKYIEKPWDNGALIYDIKNAIERSSLVVELQKKVVELETVNKKLEEYSLHLEDLVKEKTADILDINAKLLQILQNCSEGILTVNQEGKICEINSGAENIFGLSKNFIDKTPFNKIINSKTDILKSFDEKNPVKISDIAIKNPLSGKTVPIELSISPIRSEEDFLGKYVVVIRDVTAEEEVNRMRDDFIATLTHDLRTPLLASIQALEFLVNKTLGGLTEKQEQILTTMKISNQDMLGLVNALLEVYKYEAGKLNLAKTEFILNELVQNCYNEVLPLVRAKNLKFEIDLKETENEKIYADKTELRRVIINLLGNAINNTFEKGTIKIFTSMQMNDYVISVSDTGRGIPRADIPKLFKRFSQGTSQNRSVSTGLGLYLSRQIMEAHNGKIWLESDVNEGSCFSVMIPSEEAKALSKI